MNEVSTADAPVMGLCLGGAKTVVTPPVGIDLTGYIARTEPMAGVHDELYARAMVWAENDTLRDAAALLTLDVLDLDAGGVAAIRAQAAALTGIPGERIGITCTHTHGGPATLAASGLGQTDPEYLSVMYRAAASAVAMAAGRLEPVVPRVAHGFESTAGINRRVPGGSIDPEVAVLRCQRRDGTVAAMLTSYACHPVTLGPANLLATADYPGYVVRTIEAVYPGAMAHFATGCCGQINTGHTSKSSLAGSGSEWRAFGEAERLRRAVAAAAVQAAEQAARDDVALPITERPVEPARVRVARRSVALPLLPVTAPDELRRLTDEWQRELTRREREKAHPGTIAQMRVWLAWAAVLEAGELPDEITAEVMVIDLGVVALVLLPGEMFVEFGLAIKERAAPRAVVTLAYANGSPGYFPHRSAYPAGGYEVTEAYRYYGARSCFAPEAGEALVETALELLGELDGATERRALRLTPADQGSGLHDVSVEHDRYFAERDE